MMIEVPPATAMARLGTSTHGPSGLVVAHKPSKEAACSVRVCMHGALAEACSFQRSLELPQLILKLFVGP